MERTIDLYGFPTVESPEAVKTLIEKFTGEGSVCSVEVGERKLGSRARAVVEFADSAIAMYIISLAEEKRLWYGDSYLKARVYVPNTKAEHIALHFGNRVSEDKFSVQWTAEDVCVEFRKVHRELRFLFSREAVEYKFELSVDNIREIELHCPLGQPSKFLLLQLFGGPRIHQREVSNRHWARDVDFTPSSSIGQSSALCLEIPSDLQIPNLSDDFVCYSKHQGRFSLLNGSSFSSTSGLVPILLPPKGVDLPYNILFKLNSLVQHGCVPGEAVDVEFFNLVDPARNKLEHIESALDKLSHLKVCCYDPQRWLAMEYDRYKRSGRIPETSSIALEEGLVYVHRVQITPSKVYFCGPEINLSNRVLRKYRNDIDNFLRVTFVDEDLDKLHSSDLCLNRNENERTSIHHRVLSILTNGLVIGDKKFEFLAYSSSQLREGSAWMFASRDGLSAADIRAWMGDFRRIRNVAKYAARLGQSFGSSRETLSVQDHEIDLIRDVEVTRGKKKHCFSDGFAKISQEFADEVASKCGLYRFTPSAFQIRIGGFKGVVGVDPTSSAKLSLRDSMCKYESKDRKLDVLAWSKYQPCFLNRQLITLLSTLGIKDRVFLRKQKETLRRLDAILTDSKRACQELGQMFSGEIAIVLKEMIECGYKPDQEPFLAMMLQTLHASKLVEIRSKSRIYIEHGRALMGCMDETGTLEYGQVFVQCSRRSQHDGLSSQKLIVTGNVVVAKNPCLHPGDMRVLWAIDVPELHHMVDCVVFPQKGERPHPDECSGSDLDGDMYFVCWDYGLIPPQQVKPMDYTAAEAIELDHDVTIEEVAKYFLDYMLDDNLGIISNAHTVHADRQPKKARSQKCIKLAKLFSVAVDFPKTGVPAKIPHHLQAKEYPDFMENRHKPTYKSDRVIGKLYQRVKSVEDRSNSIESFTLETARKCYDTDMEVDGFEEYVADAFNHKSTFDYKLGNLMDYYGMETEAELLTGNVLNKSRYFNKKRDLESVNYAVRSLIKEARTWFEEQAGESGNEDDDDDEVCSKIASAWYHVTYHPRYWGVYNEGMSRPHFLSFAWCVFDKLSAIKRNKANLNRVIASG